MVGNPTAGQIRNRWKANGDNIERDERRDIHEPIYTSTVPGIEQFPHVQQVIPADQRRETTVAKRLLVP
jgi:hypothetical protein